MENEVHVLDTVLGACPGFDVNLPTLTIIFPEYLGNTGLQLLVIHDFQPVPLESKKAKSNVK